MTFKLRSGNAPKFKMVGSSPFRSEPIKEGTNVDDIQEVDDPMWNEEGYDPAVHGDKEQRKKIGDKVDAKRKADEAAKKAEELKNKQKANPSKVIKPKNWWEEGYGQDTKTKTTDKYDSEGNLLEPEKKDFFSDLRPLQRALGLSKEQRAARKLKKANRLTDAKAAEADGTETFKQAKFVDKAERKQAKSKKKIARKKAKSDKKLAEYRKKNG